MTGDVAEAVRASSLGELCWVDAGGRPQVRGVIALVRGGRPAVAFTYADEAVAREVASRPRLGLALTEPRSTGTTFAPMLLTATPLLTEDPTGDVYTSELVVEELRRYPPARLLADSPLLMRENWWYLPRLVVELDVEALEPQPPRTGERDHLLVVAVDSVPVVRVAGRGDRDGSRLRLEVQGAAVPPGPAVLFGQDASFPDFERWTQWRYRGAWDGEALEVTEAPARVGLSAPLGLRQRWQRQRALERACTAAIPRP